MAWGRSELWSLCAGMLLLGSACLVDEDDACGKGRQFKNKVCVPKVDLPVIVDGGAPVEDAGASEDAEIIETAFGKTCKADNGCPAGSPYCAITPGDTEGYCSVTGCLTNASLCPEGYNCFDLSMFQAGLPAFCRQPE